MWLLWVQGSGVMAMVVSWLWQCDGHDVVAMMLWWPWQCPSSDSVVAMVLAWPCHDDAVSVAVSWCLGCCGAGWPWQSGGHGGVLAMMVQWPRQYPGVLPVVILAVVM